MCVCGVVFWSGFGFELCVLQKSRFLNGETEVHKKKVGEGSLSLFCLTSVIIYPVSVGPRDSGILMTYLIVDTGGLLFCRFRTGVKEGRGLPSP